ncbi:ESX-1 secretion-associated protein EspI-like [Pongo pygmaeus]|uniref:ESX-1 secretion-associated protein EspI-like n=1 Tax=Pongo pygmaeus TaxID=9600 RepID=UPI0023E25608|nr:ESX-1 secretion-associated protein EspI-like [Pongo pygmaeus]
MLITSQNSYLFVCMRGIRKLNSIPCDCRVAIPAAPGSSRGRPGQVTPPGGPSGMARTHSRGHPDHAPPPGHPSCSLPLCAGSSCLATPEPARTPSLAEPGPGVPVAVVKPCILPGGGCTGSRTEKPPLSPTRGDCRVPMAAAPISLRWRSGWQARPGGPQAWHAGDPEADQAMHLHPAWAPKLQPTSVCRQQPPGISRARPHSPHLGNRTRFSCGCGQARRSALQQLHEGRKRPSVPSPVAAEGP